MELRELVKKELKGKRSSKKTVLLCDKIFRWYDEGREPQIEENIEKMIKKIISPAEKEIRKMRGMAPRRVKKKRYRQRR
jgi:hypothetical protein